MFIAHLPAAYLVLKSAPFKLGATASTAFLIGSIAPDVDMAYFYLIDGRQHHHHDYLTHRPVLWYLVLLLGLCLSQTRLGKSCLALGLGALLHLLLDSITGKIGWLWPVLGWTAPLVVVPATHDFWVVSFLSHWTFKVEVAITLIAAYTFRRTTKNPAR